MKKCSKCQINKSLTEFDKNRSKKSGYSHYCKPCKKIDYSEMYIRNGISYNEHRRNKGLAQYKLGLCFKCTKERLSDSKYCLYHYVGLLVRNSDPKEYAQSPHKSCLIEPLIQKITTHCPYTGAPLVFGVNASLEHKLPRSKYPHLKWNLDNLEWVDRTYNLLKNDATNIEFNRHYKITYIP